MHQSLNLGYPDFTRKSLDRKSLDATGYHPPGCPPARRHPEPPRHRTPSRSPGVLARSRRERDVSLAQARIIEVVEIGDRVPRAVGRDDVVLAIG